MSARISDVELLKDLCQIESGLNDWEVEFVESTSRWLDTHDSLTDPQRRTALRIYDKLCVDA